MVVKHSGQGGLAGGEHTPSALGPRSQRDSLEVGETGSSNHPSRSSDPKGFPGVPAGRSKGSREELGEEPSPEPGRPPARPKR